MLGEDEMVATIVDWLAELGCLVEFGGVSRRMDCTFMSEKRKGDGRPGTSRSESVARRP